MDAALQKHKVITGTSHQSVYSVELTEYNTIIFRVTALTQGFRER